MSVALYSKNEIESQQQEQREQIDLFKRTYCKGCSDDELMLFYQVCKRTGLRPETRQIYSVPRWDVAEQKNIRAIQVSVDGFRLIAERTGKYRGQVGPFWCGEDGVWKDVWLSNTAPMAAKVGVIHADFTEPLWAVARFDSYAQTKKGGGLTSMWEKMSDVMIAKCAECLALRKAFPQDLSGIYSEEEMAQADNVVQIAHNHRDPEALPESTELSLTAKKDALRHRIKEAWDKAAINEEEYGNMMNKVSSMLTDKMLDTANTWVVQKIINHQKQGVTA